MALRTSFWKTLALSRYPLDVSSEIAQLEDPQVSFMLSCRCSIQRGSSFLLTLNFLFSYVKIRKNECCEPKGNEFHVALHIGKKA